MRKIHYMIMFSCLLISSCRDKQPAVVTLDVVTATHSDTNCFEKEEKELAITAILQTNEFQMYLHPEVSGRLPILLVKNDFITDDLVISSNGHQIQYRDSLELPRGNIHRIRITDIDCQNLKLSYSVFYPIEGSVIQGNVTKSNRGWVASVTHVGEYHYEL